MALVAHGAHEHRNLLGRDTRAQQPGHVGGDRLGLSALVRAAPEADVTGADGTDHLRQPVGQRLDHRPGRPQDAVGAPEGVLEPHRLQAGKLGREVAHVLRSGAAHAPDRLVVVTRRDQVAVLGDEGEDEPHVGVLEVLQVVDEHVPVVSGDAGPDVWLRRQQRVRLEHQVAEVQAALRGEHRVVRLVDRRELPLALGALVPGGQPGRPAGVFDRGDHRLLEAVDAGDHAREHRSGVAAEVVPAQGQLVDALQQHREPVGGCHGRHERADPRLERLVVQQAGAEPVHGVDGELGEAAIEAVLDAAAQRICRALRRRQREDLLGLGCTTRRKPGMTGQQRAGLARPGAAHDEQGAAAVGDDPALLSGEAVERIGHVPRICGRWRSPPRATARRSWPTTGSAPAAGPWTGFEPCWPTTPRAGSA